MNDRAFAQMIRLRSREIAQTEREIGGRRETEMIAYWRAMRPRMTARLERRGILEAFAHVLNELRAQEQDRLQASRMAWTDAAEQAEQAWTLMTPEADDQDAADEADEEAGALPRQLLQRLKATAHQTPPRNKPKT